MSGNEQRAHDVAVAIVSCAEQAKQNAIIAESMKQGKSEIPISVNPDAFIHAYNVAYEKALAALEQ